jgi:SAM-dependent methyltransferase
MNLDIRAAAAKYYDLNPEFPQDIAFYRTLIPSPDATVLELGCGTGRVMLPLSATCQSIHRIDLSASMVAICQEKLVQAGIPVGKAKVEVGDITSFDLGRRFDLLLAPFRVFQNLETDMQVDGLFDCIHRHLAPRGACVLNVFKPKKERVDLIKQWVSPSEVLEWEIPSPGGRIACSSRRTRLDPDKLVLYPELIYRRYRGAEVVEEVVLNIAMRCYYPDQFISLIEGHGLKVLNRWGGYRGEAFGEGPELIVQFMQSPG